MPKIYLWTLYAFSTLMIIYYVLGINKKIAIYQARETVFDKGFTSSPVLVGDRIYAIDIAGTVHIFGATGEYIEIGTIETGEPVYATPAFMDGRIYIRGDNNLYCIGK